MQITTSLSERLNARQDEYRYLLLDPLKQVAAWNPLHLNHLDEAWGSDSLHCVLRPDLAWSPEHCPQLLLLASPGAQCDEQTVLRSIEYASDEVLYEKRYVCGWLSSSMAPEEMSEWLADLCKQIKPGSIVPIFEPQRLELLQATANPILLGALVEQISQWHILSCTGELMTLSGNANGGTWQLNWGAELTQSNARDIWRLLFAWKEVTATLPPDAARLAAHAWNTSGKTGLHRLSDRFFLALNILTLPVDIMEHISVKKLLQQVADTPDLQFAQLFQMLPENVWQ